MAEKYTKKSIIAEIFVLIFVIFAVAIFVTFFKAIESGREDDNMVTIDQVFDVTLNDKKYDKTTTLPDSSLPRPGKGDTVSFSFVLPDEKIADPELSIYVDHAALKVYFNDELVFEKGNKDSKMLGHGYINVPLPYGFSGIRIKVEMYITENGGKTVFQAPAIFSSRKQLRNFIVDNSLYFVIDMAIILISMTIVIIGFFFSRLSTAFRRLTLLGIAFFLMGLWEMCNYNLVSIFSDSLVFKGYLEYSSLYIGPFFLALYFYTEFFRHESRLTKIIYKSVVAAQGVFSASVFILHFTDVVHLPEVLPVCHILLLVNIGIVLTLLIRQLARKNNTHKYMIVGLIMIIIFTILDLARFNIQKYFFNGTSNYDASYLMVGFFVFLITLLIDFFMNQRKSLYKMAKAEAMDKLAHVDMMTGLANRLRCEEVFEELKNSSDVYGIISMDINYLKLTNDKYGHQEGDRLLKDFSNILIEAIKDTDYTAVRMGGDEFAIILPKTNKGTILKLLSNIEDKKNEVNKDRKPFPVSFAYGFCLSDDDKILEIGDTSDKVEEVYKISDERMYEHKKEMKKANSV